MVNEVEDFIFSPRGLICIGAYIACNVGGVAAGLGAIFFGMASAPEMDITSCSVAGIDIEGECVHRVQTPLTGTDLFEFTYSGESPMDTFAVKYDCTLANATECSLDVLPLNCTGDCWVNADRSEVSIYNSANYVWGFLAVCFIGSGTFLLCVASVACIGVCCHSESNSSPSSQRWASAEAVDEASAVLQEVRKWLVRSACPVSLCAVILLVTGYTTFDAAEVEMHEAATCTAVTVLDGVVCFIGVQTDITGGANLSFASDPVFSAWFEDNRCAGAESRAWPSMYCDPDQQLDCSGDCWVAEDRTMVYDGPGGGLGLFALATLLTACGFFAFVTCSCCCHCASLVGLGLSEAAPPGSQVQGQAIGVAHPEARTGPEPLQGEALNAARDAARISKVLDRGTKAGRTLVSCIASVGILLFLFIGVVLLRMSWRFELDSQISLAGFAAATLIAVFAGALIALLRHLARGFKRTVQELSRVSSSGDDLKLALAKMLAEQLQSRHGKKLRGMLYEHGVSETHLQAALELTPEEAGRAILALLAANVLARLICDHIEGMLTPYYENFQMAVLGVFIVMPGFITVVLLNEALFAISFEPRIDTLVAAFLVQVATIAIHQQMFKLYMAVAAPVSLYLVFAVVVAWAMEYATVLSVVCWNASLPVCVVWYYFIFEYNWYFMPWVDLQWNMMLEMMRDEIWSTFLLERDPATLTELRDEYRQLERRMGPARTWRYTLILGGGMEVPDWGALAANNRLQQS